MTLFCDQADGMQPDVIIWPLSLLLSLISCVKYQVTLMFRGSNQTDLGKNC